MKKIFLKILSVFGIASVIAGLILPVISAQAAFNNDPLDVKTIKIANSTRDVGTYNWAASTTADAGNDIALLVYYHNTAATTATNTRARVNFSSASQTTQTISVNIWSDNDPAISDSVVLNISSAQTVTFISGSTRWYPNQNSGANQVLPFGQSGDEIISANGLNIGDMVSGWGAQGYISLKARISNNATPVTPNPGPVVAAPAVTTYAASNISANSAILNSIINPNSASTTAWFEYGTNYNSLNYSIGNQNLGAGSIAVNMPVALSNLSPNTTYYFRAMAQNSQGTVSGNVLSFTTLQTTTTTTAPSVTTNSASNISATSANLNSIVNPNNAATNTWFEYGTTSSSLSYATSTQSLSSSSASSTLTSAVSGLFSNTTYYFRAVASNSAGTTYGSILSFTTLQTTTTTTAPSVTTNSASNISATSANLNSIVNPNNAATNTWFEYGTTSSSLSYATSTQSLSSSSASSTLTSAVSGLSSNTTYYFRAVASNSAGTTYGSILSFTTSQIQTNSSAPSVTTNAATAIAATSANLNSTINPRGLSTDARFDYGVSMTNLDKTTTVQNINGSSYVPVTIGISGLSSNTVYYFRPVASNSAGTTYGAINSFTTGLVSTSVSTTTTTSSVNRSVNVTTTSTSPFIEVSQSVENLTHPNGDKSSNFADIGDKLKYAITLKNSGGASGNNLKVSARIPNVFKYIESSQFSSYDSVSNIVSWNISSLKSGESTTSYFIVEVQSGLNTTVINQVQAYIPAKSLNIYSNSVSTFISKQKPVSLKFAVDENEVGIGDELNYSIIIRNDNDYMVKNILLSVGLPENVEITNIDFPISSKTDNSLIIDLGAIQSGQEIVKKISVKVGANAKTNDILTAIAIVNYQDQAGNNQPVVSASVSSAITGSANLAASIFGGIGSFSFFDWLTIIGILVFIFIASYLSRGVLGKIKSRTTQQ